MVVVKDLTVKGAPKSVKAGTKVKNIRLTDGDHNIDCKIEEVCFYDMVERAFEYQETAIGYRRMSEQDSIERNFGIVLNPIKDKVIPFTSKDYLIVLALN